MCQNQLATTCVTSIARRILFRSALQAYLWLQITETIAKFFREPVTDGPPCYPTERKVPNRSGQ